MNQHNDTIIKMMNYVKPSINKMVEDPVDPADDTSSTENTPLKRSASSQSVSEESHETPLKRFKQDVKFDLDYVGSPREVRKVRADLIEARNTILNLENRISHMHGIRKEMQVLFDNETRTLRKQREYDRKSVLELENHLQSIRKREHELKKELAEVKNRYDVFKLTTDQKIEELEKKLCDISMEHKVTEGVGVTDIGNLQRKVVELENRVKLAQEECEVHQKLSKELEKELEKKRGEVTELELKNKEIQKLKLQIKEYDFVKENYNEYREQSEVHAQKLSKLLELEKENEKLREENYRIKDEIKNKLILEEEVYDLKKRLVKFKEQEAKFSNVQMQLVQNEMYLNEWKAVARGTLEEASVNDTALPHLLRKTVERLQQQELTLTDEKVNLQSQLNTAVHEAKLAKEELSKTQKLLTKLTGIDEQKKNLIHRMQKKLLLVSRERDSYRLQLDSYEKDLTMCVNTSALGTQAASQVQGLKERVENLEKVITGYRDYVAKLENDIQNKEHDGTSDLPPVKLEQISRLQDEVNRLKHENARLCERKDQLEIQLEEYLVGNDSLRGGNVYHLAMNPLSECVNQREALVDKLQEEVDRLKRKVKNMEEGAESSKLIDISMSTKEVQMLKEEIKNQEMQTQHLKELFKSSMQEFREVVYMMLGYKIDRSSKSLYKITSMYAENAEDVLCFQLNSGHLNLLETDYSTRLEDLIELHLRHQNSIPNFLSSLTLDLYSNRTMVTEQLEIIDD